MRPVLVPYVFDAFTASIARDHGFAEVVVGGADLSATIGYGGTAPTIDDLCIAVRQCLSSGAAVAAELSGFYSNTPELLLCIRKLAAAGASRIIVQPRAADAGLVVAECALLGVKASLLIADDDNARSASALAGGDAVELIEDRTASGGAGVSLASASAIKIAAESASEVSAMLRASGTATRVYLSVFIRSISDQAVKEQLRAIQRDGRSGDQKLFYEARLRKESLIGLNQMLDLEKRTVEKVAAV